MREITCAACGAAILEDDENPINHCHACGGNLRRPPLRSPGTKKNIPVAGQMAIAIGIALSVAIALVASILTQAGGIGSGATPRSLSPEHQKRQEERAWTARMQSEVGQLARNLVRQSIDQRLRHTVKFPMLGDYPVKRIPYNNRWVASGEFEAMNIFGATLRHTYTTTIENAGQINAPDWRLVEMTIDGEQVYPPSSTSEGL